MTTFNRAGVAISPSVRPAATPEELIEFNTVKYSNRACVVILLDNGRIALAGNDRKFISIIESVDDLFFHLTKANVTDRREQKNRAIAFEEEMRTTRSILDDLDLDL